MNLSQEDLELKAAKLRKEYNREYRKAHKEQSKQYMKTYWEKKAIEDLEHDRMDEQERQELDTQNDLMGGTR